MAVLDLLLHLIGLLLPAAAVALGVAAADRFSGAKSPPARALPAQAAINFAAGAAALVAGLVATGHDGRMWVYGAMVGAVALAQALGRRRLHGGAQAEGPPPA